MPPKVLEFLAHKITSNVRELEGALNRIYAHAQLVGREITLESAQEVLHDLLRANDRRVTIDEIQKRVAEHYNIRFADMHSARRARAVARPRQVAMYLCKQLTPRSLPEIGRKFGGRDHTTVMHAVRKIEELRAERPRHGRGHRAAAPDARKLSKGLPAPLPLATRSVPEYPSHRAGKGHSEGPSAVSGRPKTGLFRHPRRFRRSVRAWVAVL